jgi:hypothetical protein
MSEAAGTCGRGLFAKRSQFRATLIAAGAGRGKITMPQIVIDSPHAATFFRHHVIR